MDISPDTISDESREMAKRLYSVGPISEHSDKQLDQFTQANFDIKTNSLKSGKTAITIDRYTIAPEHGGDTLFEPSGETVELIYDSEGQLELVRDIPFGYDAAWSIARIADAIIPERRKAKQALIAHRTEALIRAATVLTSSPDLDT